MSRMGKQYTEPTSYRDRQCPHCGLYFSSRGLNGHIRFRHPRGDTLSGLEMEKIKLLGEINTEAGLKKALRMFLIEWLTKGIGP